MNPFSAKRPETVSSLGEGALITQLSRWLGEVCPAAPHGIGDDCAVLPASKGETLVTVDPVIFGRHFDASAKPELVGAKLLNRNASDIAAMGGTPTSAVVGLALPGNVRISWIRGFYRGLAAAAKQQGIAVVGGDVAQTSQDLVASLTLLGTTTAGRAVTRTGARDRDRIFVTGSLGGSLLGHHLRFTPRLAEGRWLARRKDVRSMMDVSDGLAKDALALGAPGLRPLLHVASLPLSAAAKRLAKRSGQPAWRHALTDGEDYELVFTLAHEADPHAFCEAWNRHFDTPLTQVGVLTRSQSLPDGWIDPANLQGYEHLR